MRSARLGYTHVGPELFVCKQASLGKIYAFLCYFCLRLRLSASVVFILIRDNVQLQDGQKLSDKPIIPDERFARPQPEQPKKEEEPEPTLASKYGITLPGVPMEGTNTYTGVQGAEDLSSNLPVIVSVDTTVAHTGLGRSAAGGGGSFGFTGAADNAHSAAYGGAGAANSPEVMAKKAADITTALGVNDHVAGI